MEYPRSRSGLKFCSYHDGGVVITSDVIFDEIENENSEIHYKFNRKTGSYESEGPTKISLAPDLRTEQFNLRTSEVGSPDLEISEQKYLKEMTTSRSLEFINNSMTMLSDYVLDSRYVPEGSVDDENLASSYHFEEFPNTNAWDPDRELRPFAKL